MQNSSSPTTDRTTLLLLAVFLISYMSYLVSSHYVKGYSDPTHWIIMAENLLYRGTVHRWSSVFAMYLIAPLVLLGNHYVYLSNILWLAGLVTATCTLVAVTCRRPGEPPLWTAGLLGALSLVTFHGEVVRELVNPYREPFSYTMLLVALNFIMLQGSGGRTVWGVLSGITFGIAVGARESNFFILLPVVILFLYFGARTPGRGWRLPLSFAAGLFPGLLPFFMHNHLYWGVWWLPSYMKRKVLTLAPGIEPSFLFRFGTAVILVAALLMAAVILLLMWRRRGVETHRAPRKGTLLFLAVVLALLTMVLGVLSQKFELVPGMKFSRFWPGLIKTSRHLFSRIGWAGALLALFGVGYAWRKRFHPFLIIYAPSACIFLWFWSHYRYVKFRYIFAIELFLYPLVGVGLWGLLALIGRAAKPGSPLRSIPRFATWILALIAVARLGHMALEGTNNVKVWHLESLKEQLEETLEQPYVFYSNRNHYSQILSTVSGYPFTSVFFSSTDQFYLRGPKVEEQGMDGVLSEVRARAFALLDEKHIYSYLDHRHPVVQQWFDFVPVLDMADLSPPLKVYRKTLDGHLYEIRPWEKSEVVVDLELPETATYLLGLDAFRIWDDSERRFCRASINGQAVSESVENGFHYYPVLTGESKGRTAQLRISSDTPLPRDPGIEIVELNGAHNMKFRREPLKWMSFISPELRGGLFASHYGANLCRTGRVTIPHFADSRQNVFVRIYYRENPKSASSGVETYLSLAGKSVSKHLGLRPGRKPSSFVADLGAGRNHYSPEELHLSLTADTAGTPRPAGSPCYVVPAVRVWTLPNTVESTTFFPADTDHEPVFEEGFYSPERSASGFSQWSRPKAVIRLPRIQGKESRPSLVVRTNELRPPAFRSSPEFILNGRKAALQTRERPGQRVEYVLTDLDWSDERANRLAVAVETFNPKKVTGSRDQRDLGISIIGVEIVF